MTHRVEKIIEYPDIAWNATRNLLLCLGAIGLFAYVSTLHWYLAIPSLAILAAMWYLLYRFEVNYRTSRLERMDY